MVARSPLLRKWSTVDPDLPTIVDAHDEFLETESGETIIDAAAGASVVNLGHSLSGVADVASDQLETFGYVNMKGFDHPKGVELSEKLAAIAPSDLNTAFFVNSGSEANEAAFKLARAYHEPSSKNTIIGRWQSYHGSTIGALSAGGKSWDQHRYKPMLKEWPHIGQAHPFRWDYSGSPKEQAIAAARELETTIRREGPESVAAFIAEPVGGSNIPAAHPHPAYYEEIRRICDEYDVLFIADEVLVGFGRTGELFAVEHFDVVPDIMTIGKGLSSGYAPISAVMMREKVAAEFEGEDGKIFNHGHAFGGHPPSAAIASHVVDEYTEDLLATCRERGEQLADALAPLRDHPMVGEFRQIGLLVGIEFVADRSDNYPYDPDLEVASRISETVLENGVYIFPGGGTIDGVAGDHIMISPPLTVSANTISDIASVIVDSVERVYDDLPEGESAKYSGNL